MSVVLSHSRVSRVLRVALLTFALMAGGLTAQEIPTTLTSADFFALRVLPEPLVPAGSESTPAENAALAAALNTFQKRSATDDFSALEEFASANPGSSWRLAVLTNLGLLYYHAGYFSRCIPTFHEAWEAGKNATGLKAKSLADRAAGEYAKMLARLGRRDELKAFLRETDGRQFIGQSTELMTAGREGAATMTARPEISFRCGPFALSRILAAQGSAHRADPAIMEARSSAQGMSLAEVADISRKVGLDYQVARRQAGAPLILPSVIHWKVGHYAALLKQTGDQFLTQDPTFENETWHSRKALDAEASGYFLVPPGPLPPGWSAVSREEAATVYGKGQTSGPSPKPLPGDLVCGGFCPLPGMAIYSFRTMLASLEMTDTPVGYRPPYGDPMLFTVHYVQRDPGQPSNFNYSNLGPKWDFVWQRYITDDPAKPGTISQSTADGSYLDYAYTGTTDDKYTYGIQFDTFNQVSRPVANPSYTVTHPDGSREVYGRSDGSTAAPRKVFLTQLIDTAGNKTTLTYDSQLRLVRATDALGQVTTLSYGLAADPYKITKVTDPFGRSATFSYDDTGRLTQIQDVIGIQSKFGYDGTGDFLNSLTTPYGTTTFTVNDVGEVRRLTATDPLGDPEVLESSYTSTSAVPSSESTYPSGMPLINQYLQYRDSFHWNHKQWKESPNDYSKAHLYHWLHDVNQSQTSAYLESEKPPLENRIWYSYTGQPQQNVVGSNSLPAYVGKYTESGSQVSQFAYNTLGRVIRQTDPLGRIETYSYAANGIDLASKVHGVDNSHLAINIGGGAVENFTADPGASGSSTYSTGTAIDLGAVTNPAPAAVYQNGRYGKEFSYTFSGRTAGAPCTLRLHFAETYYTSAGQRVFNVLVNGNTQVAGLDVFAEAGNAVNKAVIKEVNANADADGNVTVTFAATLDNAIIAGIEVIDPTAPALPVLAAFTWNAQHRPLTYTDAAGQVTTYAWNAFGQVTSLKNPKGETTTFSYYDADAAGKKRKGRLSQVVGALAGGMDATAFDYDASGHVASVTGPDGYALAFAHDALDRPTKVTYPDGTYAQTTYQALDPLTRRDRLGRVTHFTYNGIRELISVTDPANRTVQYHWCKCGALQQLIDPLGRVTTWRYDVHGRPTAKVYADGSTISYAYEPLSARLATVTDEKGQVKTRAYNLDDTLAGISYANTEHSTPNVAFTYDPDYLRLTGMTDGIGQTVYTYRPVAPGSLGAGQVATVDGPWASDTITYTYDKLGRSVSRAVGSVTQTRTFDAAGRVGTVSNALGTFTYGYDGATSRLASAAHNGGVKTLFTYLPNAQGRHLQEIRNLKPDGTTPLSVFDYTYDAAGRILTWLQQADQQAAQTWTLGYDAADQLTSATVKQGTTTQQTYGWTYDPASNRKTQTIGAATATTGYNALDELDRSTQSEPARTYEWDAENRLTAINQGTARSEFAYDGVGRRVKITEKTNGAVTAASSYLWSGLTIAERRDASGGVVRQRFFPQGFQGDANSPSSVYLYTTDHLGSVRESVDATGAVKERIGYDLWGKPTFSNATPLDAFAYTGHLWHAPSGLSLAPFRAYDAAPGRWLSRDPLGEAGLPNLYRYAVNNPVSFVDPTGLEETPNPGDLIDAINQYLTTLTELRRTGELIDIYQKGNFEFDFTAVPYENRKQAQEEVFGAFDKLRGPLPASNVCTGDQPSGYPETELRAGPSEPPTILYVVPVTGEGIIGPVEYQLRTERPY